jgi:hypothetical protein
MRKLYRSALSALNIRSAYGGLHNFWYLYHHI